MKKNVTICLSRIAIRALKEVAAIKGVSASGLIEELIREKYKKVFKNSLVMTNHALPDGFKDELSEKDFEEMIKYAKKMFKIKD